MSIIYGEGFTYYLNTVSKDNALSSLDSMEYDGDIYANHSAILDYRPTQRDINEHCKSFIRSYYQTAYKQNDANKEDYIERVANDKIVHVNSYATKGLNSFEEQPKENSNKHDYAAQENKICFMSTERNSLSREAVESFYGDLIEIASNYATITEQVQSLEEQISNAWKIC